MNRPIDALLGNIDPLTGLRRGRIGGNASYMQSPVKMSTLPQIGNNAGYNENIAMRSGNKIPVRPMTNAGVIAGSNPKLVAPNVVGQNQNQNSFSGLLGKNFSDPKTMGLLGASAELMKAGGYSVGKPAPTMGEAIGNAMNTGMANYLAVQQAQNKLNAPISVAKGGKVYSRDGKLLIDNSQGFGFSGTGFTNQSANTVLQYSEGAKKGTLTPAEMAKYKLAFGYLNKEKNIPIPNDKGGVDYIKEAPQNLDGFFNPFPENRDSSKVGEKLSPKELKFIEQKPKLFKMLGNLNKYKINLKKIDFATQFSGAIEFPTPQATQLTTDAEALRLNIKDLEDLGALVGGDFQILANRLTSPNTTQGITMGKEGLIIQLEALENQLLNELQEGGIGYATGALSDPIPANDPKVWKEGRFGLYYQMPNGDIALKDRKLR